MDGDSAILACAAAKAGRAGAAIRWSLGLATELPYARHSFDRVVSSLVMHHLADPDKARALRESCRVLRPGGELHILDFGPPRDRYGGIVAGIMRHFEETAAQFDGRLPDLIRAVGFTHVEIRHRFTVLFGPLDSLRAVKP